MLRQKRKNASQCRAVSLEGLVPRIAFLSVAQSQPRSLSFWPWVKDTHSTMGRPSIGPVVSSKVAAHPCSLKAFERQLTVKM